MVRKANYLRAKTKQAHVDTGSPTDVIGGPTEAGYISERATTHNTRLAAKHRTLIVCLAKVPRTNAHHLRPGSR